MTPSANYTISGANDLTQSSTAVTSNGNSSISQVHATTTTLENYSGVVTLKYDDAWSANRAMGWHGEGGLAPCRRRGRRSNSSERKGGRLRSKREHHSLLRAPLRGAREAGGPL